MILCSLIAIGCRSLPFHIGRKHAVPIRCDAMLCCILLDRDDGNNVLLCTAHILDRVCSFVLMQTRFVAGLFRCIFCVYVDSGADSQTDKTHE